MLTKVRKLDTKYFFFIFFDEDCAEFMNILSRGLTSVFSFELNSIWSINLQSKKLLIDAAINCQ